MPSGDDQSAFKEVHTVDGRSYYLLAKSAHDALVAITRMLGNSYKGSAQTIVAEWSSFSTRRGVACGLSGQNHQYGR